MAERKIKVLVVDDIPENRKLLATILTKHTDYEVSLAQEGRAVVENIEKDPPDIILLDIMMPDMDGYEVASRLRLNHATMNIPIIFITALDKIEDKVKAFDAGGVDYIVKPFNQKEVIKRISTHIELKKYRDRLEQEVKSRTAEIEQINGVLISALETANYYNDDNTGNHIKRVSHYSRILAENLGLPTEKANEIYRYASLHDIGKIGVPNLILKKPESLTPEERKRMQEHTVIGFRMIDLPGVPETAKNIILYHHERWDGGGYPRGLKGQEIPVEAKIVALADVYDALRSRRPYKKPISETESHGIIVEAAGKHFDPRIVEVYKNSRELFLRIHEGFKEVSEAADAAS